MVERSASDYRALIERSTGFFCMSGHFCAMQKKSCSTTCSLTSVVYVTFIVTKFSPQQMAHKVTKSLTQTKQMSLQPMQFLPLPVVLVLLQQQLPQRLLMLLQLWSQVGCICNKDNRQLKAEILHGGLICIAFCLSVCHWMIIHISGSNQVRNLKLYHNILRL